MDNNVKNFDYIKNQVKQLIKDNLHREVTSETKHNISGIYMIYIDNFTPEKILPIYIGKSNNIQRRYKKHFEEILALNRLSYDEYHKYFFFESQSFYEGNFKSCKIFKYMIENKCTLQDFHMIVLEEVEEEYLDEKEQEYFQRLLPSFFGFNQLNSLLKQIKFRFSNLEMSNSEIEVYLRILLEDIKGINSYYEYGFTRFNFEHSIPKDISYLLEEKGQLDGDMLLKFDEVKLSLYEMCKRYISDFEEMKRLFEQKNRLYEVYKIARDECYEALDLLKRVISEKFEELKIYSEEAIKNFIYSIEYKNNPKYKELFNKYLKSQKCKMNFYEIFDEQIKDFNKKSEEKNAKNIPYSEALDLNLKREDEIRPERYKMIFPSSQFESFSLGDRSNFLSIKLNEDSDLLNTCHIQMYISNNGVNRSIEVYKEPFIIRFDYCFIDNQGNKTENEYYIDNETTRNCQSGIQYFEKDFYNMFAFQKEKFKISSLINNEIDNSFISVLAEYKHGINDYTIKDKKLIKLTAVLDEIQQLTDEETRFNIDVSESANCLKKCIMNERLQNNEFVEQILLTKKLLKLKKRKKSPIKKAKEVVNKTDLTENNKVKRAVAFKQNVLIKSNNNVDVLNYVSSREKAIAHCKSCGHKWEIRSDHLLARPYCPLCRKMTNNI
ncbi:excinuclease ABC subunit C [Metabacillus hrfriensis]|uniref:Excinuclease ABC subunit C n=1 Tax=Metabacillus hrfriensis TaxID=3048891 RepID=A0ACD4RI30_9BACI|nr:excinuclease ABC subunit C [Metabacillus sp. CT-WN-B3]WHZ60031.1 excinuclease ABC subunit C [Metabacillus sp. CT-WN-B3]